MRQLLATCIAALFLLTPMALAESHTSDCDKEYRKDVQSAQENRDEAMRRSEDKRQESGRGQSEARSQEAREDQERIREDYASERRDAERDHEECEKRDHGNDRAKDARDRRHGRDAQSLPIPEAVDGKHVDFQIVDGNLANYSIENMTLLSLVDARGNLTEYRTRGAVHEFSGEGADLRSIDSRAGNIQVRGAATLTAADGYSFEFADNSTHKVRLVDSENATLAKITGRNLSIDNGTITGFEVKFHASGSGDHEDVEDAISNGDVAGRVKISKKSSEAIALGPVDLFSDQKSGEFILTVDGEGVGKTIIFDVERNALGPIEDLVVKFDGEIIGRATDLADVLDVSDGVAEYLIILGEDGPQILVQIPHFSVHEITLQGSSVTPVSPPVMLLIAGVSVAALLIVGTQLVRKRKA